MKTFFTTVLIGLSVLLCFDYLLIINLAGEHESEPQVVSYQDHVEKKRDSSPVNKAVTLLSLNLAHGRRDRAHQLFLTTTEIRNNLDKIIAMLKREQPDFVALQEADAPSLWSGHFSHVTYLARNAGYVNSIHGIHVEGLKLSYGTAILSTKLLKYPLSITFTPAMPALTKGFTIARVKIGGALETDVVSVHLDFFSLKTRRKQVKQMVQALSLRSSPLIIMGDFNQQWGEKAAPTLLSAKLNLTTHSPLNHKGVTFPKLQKRIDYILISKEFEFIDYQVLQDVVSDHRAILAKIKIKDQ